MQRTYTIKQFAQVSGVSEHTLRYFDKIGLLCPERGENGYRYYSLKQVSIAEGIILLQRAMFSNAEIKQLLNDYNSAETLESLKANHKKLRRQIFSLRSAYNLLGEHIDNLERLNTVRQQLNQPFWQSREEKTVGLIESKHDCDIVEFFDAGDEVIGNPSWPHFHTHGMLVPVSQLSERGYPLHAMYIDHPKAIKASPFTLPAGDYLCMYCSHSMENNPHVPQLMQYASESGYEFLPYLLVEQVSGPVVEKQKQDFLVKLMLICKDSVPDGAGIT